MGTLNAIYTSARPTEQHYRNSYSLLNSHKNASWKIYLALMAPKPKVKCPDMPGLLVRLSGRCADAGIDVVVTRGAPALGQVDEVCRRLLSFSARYYAVG